MNIIHPFMDWYLMGPVFGFRLEELKDVKLQKLIIQRYAPELKDIPFSVYLDEVLLRQRGERIKDKIKRSGVPGYRRIRYKSDIAEVRSEYKFKDDAYFECKKAA